VSRLVTMIVQNGDFRALFRSPAKLGEKALLIGPAPELYNYLRDTSRRSEGLQFNPIGLIETSQGYNGRSIRSVPVLGGIRDLRELYPKIAGQGRDSLQLISVDVNPDKKQTAELIKAAAELNAPLARMTHDMNGNLSAFEAADLIGRDMRYLDLEPVQAMIAGRRSLCPAK